MNMFHSSTVARTWYTLLLSTISEFGNETQWSSMMNILFIFYSSLGFYPVFLRTIYGKDNRDMKVELKMDKRHEWHHSSWGGNSGVYETADSGSWSLVVLEFGRQILFNITFTFERLEPWWTPDAKGFLYQISSQLQLSYNLTMYVSQSVSVFHIFIPYFLRRVRSIFFTSYF